jgi:hypothetical protein
MTLNIKLLSLLLVLLVNTTIAQTTAIPDQGFEQALIDLNIDSDGILNGQVLTADIENIIELDFSILNDPFSTYVQIDDFTGIEDFSSLEVIDLTDSEVNIPENQSDIFNSNTNLIEFIADDTIFDVGSNINIPYLDFSSLNNLEYISLVSSTTIYSINLANPNSNYENLTIDLSHEYWDPPSTYTVCINVSNAQAASSNQYPYNTWNIITPQPDQNGYVWRDYDYSSTCTLSTEDFQNLASLSAYPNPAQDILWFDNPNHIKIDKAEIYNITGQKLRTIDDVNDFIYVGSLTSGLYFVKLFSENSSNTFKVLKH